MDEQLLKQLAELTNAVKANGGTQGLDRDALVADLQKLIAEDRKALLETTPARAGERPEPVHRAVEAYQGKYRRELRDIVEHGEHRVGSWRMKGVDLWLSRLLMDAAVRSKTPGAVSPSDDLVAAVKAMTATTASAGDELVPTNEAGELWQDFFLASRIAADLPSVPMPTDPFDIPLGFGSRTWRKGTQNLGTSAADVATAKVTLTATEQVTEDDWSYNLDEDSVIAMMPALRANLAQSGGEQMDAFCLNADATATATGNINSDDGAPATDAYYLTSGQDGIRHQAIVDNTSQKVDVAGAIDDAHMAETLGKLGKYGLDYQNVRIVPDAATYLTMLGMTSVATVNTYGANATIVQGELARYRGIPILPSASMPLTEADGKCSVTAASNTKGGWVGYNRNMWRVGFRRGLTIEIDRLIQRRMLVLVTSFRIAIAAWGTRSSATHTCLAYDLTV